VNLVFAPQAWDDYLYWQKTDPQMISRINLLIKEIMRNPYAGLASPSRSSMRSKVFGRGGSLQSTESFTKKLAIKFSSHSCGIMIDKSDASPPPPRYGAPGSRVPACFKSAADTAATTVRRLSRPQWRYVARNVRLNVASSATPTR
jgi:toxin YoeB